MKKTKTSKPDKPRQITNDKLRDVTGGAGTSTTGTGHPNPPIGPGG